MQTREQLEDILRFAVWAPSGDNVQPWKFTVSSSKISVFNVPEKDLSLYNFDQAASFLSVGAVIENIRLAAKKFSFDTDIRFFPDDNPNKVAEIFFVTNKETLGGSDLVAFIKARCTNRKPYQVEPLSIPERNELLSSCADGSVELRFVEGKIKDRVADALSVNEKIVLENKNLHHFLFQHITWSHKEDAIKKGFFVDSLEMKGVKKLFFFFCSKWLFVRALSFVGIPNKISKENSIVYKASSAIGAILIKERTPLGFVRAGMAMQRIWLSATKKELSIQPLMGITLLFNRVRSGQSGDLKTSHIKLVEQSYSKIGNAFDIGDKTIAFVFRIGRGSVPSARTSRWGPVIEYQN